MEEPDLQDFNPVLAMQLWHDACNSWRPNERNVRNTENGQEKLLV